MSAAPVLLSLSLCVCGPGDGSPGDVSAADAGTSDAAIAVLARWEAATAGRVPVSAADRAAGLANAPEIPPELHALADRLRGPVDAAALRADFEWHPAGPEGKDVAALTAVPRDPLRRAFLPSATVLIGADGLPERLYGPPTKRIGCLVLGPPPAVLALRRPRLVLTENTVPAGAVIRAQGEDRADIERPNPFRTALFTRQAGDGPTWKLDRRLKKTPAVRLVGRRTAEDRTPLTAPRPR